MMEVAKPDQFDLDRLAEELGKLPEAPLAMPVQELEPAPQGDSFLSALRPRFAWVRRAGH